MRVRRRKYLVDRFQLRLVATSILYFVLAGGLFATIIMTPLVTEMWNPELTVQERSAAGQQLLEMNGRLWPAFLIMSLVVAAHSILQSHRIAGPLFRFRQVFREVAAGNLVPFDLIRQRDYLHEHASELRTMLRAQRERMRTVERLAIDLEHDVVLLETSLRSESPDGASRACREIAVDTQKLRDLTGTLKLMWDAKSEDEPSPEEPSTEAGSELEAPDVAAEGGMSIIELLLVTGLIAALGGLAVPTYMDAIGRARVAKAIGDVDAISLAVEEYRTGAGVLPDSLTEVGFTDYVDPYGRPYVYIDVRKGKARKDKFLKPLNSDFDVFSPGEDGKWSPALQSKNSKDDIIRAANGGFIGLAEDY